MGLSFLGAKIDQSGFKLNLPPSGVSDKDGSILGCRGREQVSRFFPARQKEWVVWAER